MPIGNKNKEVAKVRMVDKFSRKFFMVLWSLVFVFVFAGVVVAGPNDPDAPTELKDGKIISADEAKGLIGKKWASVFDMRTPMNYGKGHIPSSVSIPYKGKSRNTPNFNLSEDQVDFSKFPRDKNARIIIYSDGPKGWKSYKMAVAAIKEGYKDIMWLREGFSVWEKKNYPIEK